jgi:hypothetical protein
MFCSRFNELDSGFHRNDDKAIQDLALDYLYYPYLSVQSDLIRAQSFCIFSFSRRNLDEYTFSRCLLGEAG